MMRGESIKTPLYPTWCSGWSKLMATIWEQTYIYIYIFMKIKKYSKSVKYSIVYWNETTTGDVRAN